MKVTDDIRFPWGISECMESENGHHTIGRDDRFRRQHISVCRLCGARLEITEYSEEEEDHES